MVTLLTIQQMRYFKYKNFTQTVYGIFNDKLCFLYGKYDIEINKLDKKI